MSENWSSFLFHHIGYASSDLATDRTSFEGLGFRVEGKPFEDPIQKIKGQFLLNAGFRLELVEPTADDSPVQVFLKRKQKMYHQAFLVKSFADACQEMERRGARLCAPPAPSIAFQGRQICFYLSVSGELVELIQQ